MLHRGLCALAVFTGICAPPLYTQAQQAPPILWQVNHAEEYTEQAEGVVLTADGGYVVAGSVFITDTVGGKFSIGDWDVRVWKLDADGALLWMRTYGGSDADQARAIVATANGFRVVGHTSSVDGDVSGALGGGDVWLLELDADGLLLGQRCYGGSGTDEAWDATATSDGGCIVVGHSNSVDGEVSPTAGVQDQWVLRLDAAGSIVWQNTFGGSLTDEAWAVVAAPDDGCFVAGASRSPNGTFTGANGEEDYTVLRLRPTGEILWQHRLGGSSVDIATTLCPRAGGGCLVGGVTYSADGDVTTNGGLGDGWLAALDDAGTLLWQRSYGGPRANVFIDLSPAPGGGYIGVGTDADGPQLDLWVLRIDAAGEPLWEAALGGSADDQGRTVRPTNDGSFILVGHALSSNGDLTGNFGEQDMWAVKLGSDAVGIAPVMDAAFPWQLRSDGVQAWVLSATPITGEVRLHDMHGRIVRAAPMAGTEVRLSLADLAPGAYTITLHANGKRWTRMLVRP